MKTRRDQDSLSEEGNKAGAEYRIENRRSRPRSSKACVCCHVRKVRCDVAKASAGGRCTNCRLDGQKCVIRPRLRSKPLKYSTLPTSTLEEERSPPPTPHRSISLPDVVAMPEQAVSRTRKETENGSIGSTEPLQHSPVDAREDKDSLPAPSTNPFASALESLKCRPTPHTTSSTNGSPGLEGHLIFSCFSFLKCDKLTRIRSEDVRTLELQGSLHIPAQPTLDYFVEQYFMHVHPILPIVDEKRVWTVYTHQEREQESARIPLFLFQSMLFASCSFIPLNILQRCGFKSIRQARRVFYHRAKALFDLDAEHDAPTIAQGALLLSYYNSSHEKHVNTVWLKVAIQFAKADKAHLYDKDASLSAYARQMKKRLWWCCILRDRILPLGVRRPLHITREHFDFDGPTLSEEDMEGEFGFSKVYDRDTQRLLAKLLAAQCQLAIVMTDVITIGFHRVDLTNPKEFTEATGEITRCKTSLNEWFEKANSWVSKLSTCAHASVILYTSLLYIFYHSTRLTLCYHDLFALELSSALSTELYSQQIENLRADLRTSATAVTDIVRHLLQLGIVQNLPISAIAFTALPLLLTALDSKFSSQFNRMTSNKDSLEVYREATKIYEKRYDGTEEVSATIEKILSEADYHSRTFPGRQEPPSSQTPSSSSSSPDAPRELYKNLFLQQPRLQLRLAFCLDLSLSSGRFPADSDFPRPLRMDQMKCEHAKVSRGSISHLDSDPSATLIELRPTGWAQGDQVMAEDDDSTAGSGVSMADVEFIELLKEVSTTDEVAEGGHSWVEEMLALFDCNIPG